MNIEVKEVVRAKYGEAAMRVTSRGKASCCGAGTGLEASCDPISANVAGALKDSEYVGLLTAAGFENIDIEVTRVYGADEARDFLAGHGFDVDSRAKDIDGKFVSGFVRAIKRAACCAPGCCS